MLEVAGLWLVFFLPLFCVLIVVICNVNPLVCSSVCAIAIVTNLFKPQMQNVDSINMME